MKAIRSLEQHVDSLMSYDFTHLTDEELQEELAVVETAASGRSQKPSEEEWGMKRFIISRRLINGLSTRSPFL